MALGLAHWAFYEPLVEEEVWDDPARLQAVTRAKTLAQLKVYAALCYMRVSDGDIVAVDVSGDTLTLSLSKTVQRDKLRYVAYRLEPHLPDEIDHLVMIDERGKSVFDERILRLHPFASRVFLASIESS